MKRYLLLTALIFFTTSCTTTIQSWNTPYIDTDETLKLYYGMPKDEVLLALGNPLYVKKGWPNGKTNEIVWVYEVRTQLVPSNISSTGEITIVKTSSSKKQNIPGTVIHRLSVTFEDGKLNHWERHNEDKGLKTVASNLESDSSTDTITTTSTKKIGWSIQPKISRVSESWEQNYSEWGMGGEFSGDGSGLRVGINIARSLGSLGVNVGMDLSTGYGSGFMIFAEKALGSWQLALSLGTDAVQERYKQKGDFKIGFFRDFGSASIGLERLGREGGDLDGTSTFLTVRYNVIK